MDLSTKIAGPLVGLCSVAAAVGFAGWLRPTSRGLRRLGDVAGFVCLAASLAAWAVRWWHAGHLPLFGTYESSLSLALAVLLAQAIGRARAAAWATVWPVSCGVAAVLLGHGLRFDPTAFALTISERSWVVDVHAVVAWGAFGVLAANAGLALCRLLHRSKDAARLDRGLSFTLSLGFVLHSAMMASGSLYKFLLFGSAWSFDPIETLGFVAWISYGTLLHMHLFAGWEGRRLARWTLLLFIILTVSYRGIVYFPSWSTYHIFDMDLRMHLTGSGPAP